MPKKWENYVLKEKKNVRKNVVKKLEKFVVKQEIKEKM